MKKDKLSFYRSINDLPAWNFHKVSEENELKYLLILPDYLDLKDFKHTLQFELIEAWEKLIDQYIDHVGVDKKLIEKIILKRKILFLKADLLINPEKKTNITIIKTREHQLKAMDDETDSKNSPNFEEQIFALERWLKMPIDSKTITTSKFCTYRKQYNIEARQSKINTITNV